MAFGVLPPPAQFFGPPAGPPPNFGMPYGYNAGAVWSSSQEEINRGAYPGALTSNCVSVTLSHVARRQLISSTSEEELEAQRRELRSPRSVSRSSGRRSNTTTLKRARSSISFRSPPPVAWGIPPPPPPLQHYLYAAHAPYGHPPPYYPVGGAPPSPPMSTRSHSRRQRRRAPSEESTGSSKISKYRPSSSSEQRSYDKRHRQSPRRHRSDGQVCCGW